MQQKVSNTSLQQQELCIALRKRFAIKQAIDIKQHLIIEPIAPNKIGVLFKGDSYLTKEKKDLLRESLHSVYGESVSIVSLPNIRTGLVEASCSQLDIMEQGNKITFAGSDIFQKY
jgi:hypothetical protein